VGIRAERLVDPSKGVHFDRSWNNVNLFLLTYLVDATYCLICHSSRLLPRDVEKYDVVAISEI